jgi:hypothetical protein
MQEMQNEYIMEKAGTASIWRVGCEDLWSEDEDSD